MCTCWLRWVDIGFSKAQAAKGYVDRVLTSEAIDKVTFAIIRYYTGNPVPQTAEELKKLAATSIECVDSSALAKCIQ